MYGRLLLQRADEIAARVLQVSDSSRHRRLLHVDLDDGKENRDAPDGAAHKLRLLGFVNHIHLAVGRRHDDVGIGWDSRVRIPEKPKAEEREHGPDAKQDARQGGHECADERGEHPHASHDQQPHQGPEDQPQRGLSGFAFVFHGRILIGGVAQ